jgi:hypothetical protein
MIAYNGRRARAEEASSFAPTTRLDKVHKVSLDLEWSFGYTPAPYMC